MLDINLWDCTNILLAACWLGASWVQLPGNLLHITQIRQFSSASTAPANPAIEILINSGPRTPAAVLVHGTLWSKGRPNGFVSVRPEGACHQWRRVPPRELSIDLVADERLGRVTGRAEAS